VRCLLAIPLLAGLLFPPLASAQFARAFRALPSGASKTSAQLGAVRARRNFISAKSQSPVISKAGGAFSIVSPFRVETRSPWEQPAPQAGLGRELGRGRSHHRKSFSAYPFFIAPLPDVSYGYDPQLFYPSLWPPIDQQYLQARQIANGDVAGEAASQQNDLLSGQIQALTSEVESLREGGVSQTPAAPQAAVQVRSIPTVFVYRDGRSLEVRNYAIFNQTLWVFGAETTQRIPLSAINLPATLKTNQDRGVDVALPNAQ
jgi:hypothetical protein